MSDFTLSFVLKGLVNGEDGVYALTAGFGVVQPDGWYFFFDDGNPDGVGPYASKDMARRAAEAASGQVKLRAFVDKQVAYLDHVIGCLDETADELECQASESVGYDESALEASPWTLAVRKLDEAQTALKLAIQHIGDALETK